MDSVMKKITRLPAMETCLLTMMIHNFIVVSFMALVAALTQIRASQRGALDFLATLQRIPISPAMRVFLVISAYVILILCMYFKKYNLKKEDNAFFVLTCYEIVLTALIMYWLDMNYNGLVFLIVAEFLYYLGTKRNWIGFMIGAFLSYLICSYALVNIFFPFNSFETWTAYYDTKIQSYLLGAKTICEVFNIMLNTVFVFMIISRDKREKEQIRELNRQLKDANAQLHQYALEQEEMGEMKERNRLAREIHDTLGHILTGISVGVEAVQVLLDIAPDAAKAQLSTIGEMARNGLNDVRRSVRKLKPDALETKTLDRAIQDMVAEISRTTGAKIYFVSYGTDLHFEADEEETIFRMVQEGTTNSLRHGKATEVWIRMDLKENYIHINIADNGKGSEKIEEGFGLTHMRERVEMLGGSISFASDYGFTIRAQIPIRQTQTGGDSI